jgi:endonuclease/exonuclease/phosphatase family metal-dependent hydrolase
VDNITDFEPVNDRTCKIRVKLIFYNLAMISIHAPTEEKEDLVKEHFYMSLEKVCDTIPNYDMKVILGDFNVKVRKENYWYPACGRYSHHDKTNDNGEKYADFALGRDLAVNDTWFQYKDIHKVTWRSPDNQICNQIDHLLVDSRNCINVFDVRSLRGAHTESDHYLVCAKLKMKIKWSEKIKRSEMSKWNINKLMDERVKGEYKLFFHQTAMTILG